MLARDPYDPRIAFADVLGDEIIDMAGDRSQEIIGAVLGVLRRRRRLSRPVPQHLHVVGEDTTSWSFAPEDTEEDIPGGEYPLYDAIRKRFRSAIGDPKLIRVDDDESYAEFRAARRRPHLEELDSRLARLECAFHQHVSDHHGCFGNDVEAFERYLDGGAPAGGDYDKAVIGAITDAARGGKPIDLVRTARGKVDCWLDGDEVIVTAILPRGIATTGAPLGDHFEEVVGCAESVGLSGAEAVLLGCHLAPRVAGMRLLGDLCRAAPSMLDSAPFVGALSPRGNPTLAALMAVLQRCQRGDRSACREARRLSAGRWRDHIHEAADRLSSAQHIKAHSHGRVIGMDGREFGINFFGGAHTGGNILLHAFGAGQLGDQLTQLEAPILPGWAGGTAVMSPPAMPPPPNPTSPPPPKTIAIVAAPDYVVIVHRKGEHTAIKDPIVVGVIGGSRFDGNGYRRGDQNKFSFGYDLPAQVEVSLKKNKKISTVDVRQVLFLAGREQAPVSMGGICR